MLHLSCNLHRPSPSLLLPPQNLFPFPSRIDRVKFNLSKGFVKIAKISIAVNGKKSERSSEEGSSSDKWVHEGFITESLPNGMFRVRLDNEDLILGYISGKIRQNFIRVLPGDKVKVEVSRYDSSKGRIIYRLRNRSSSD
ncbi:translation initiation factor IF-1, chloroplastic-like [Mangifera indica]|uniref:translation initiation factor IF-1, chloroplastic-like n=1 Tax=Mangifera indica TaxID=29780 RepID=UPI001CF9CDC8|nr:translation initiation factor IF-1, chloroplastic-like [Mangifera indica]